MEGERILEILWLKGDTVLSQLLSRAYHLLEQEEEGCVYLGDENKTNVKEITKRKKKKKKESRHGNSRNYVNNRKRGM